MQIGNRKAFQLLEVQKTNPKGIVFTGKRGLGMLEAAEAFAKDLLKTDREIDTHPDFIRITKVEGKQSIGVEDVLPLIKMTELVPALAPYKVCIIEELDRLTVPAENKLLKILEDNRTMVILAISYSGSILPTIQSRVAIIPFHSLERNEFMDYCQKLQYPTDDFYFLATRGCPLLIPELSPVKDIFQAVYRDFVKDRKQLLMHLHVFKEKDKEHFMEKYRDFLPSLFYLLEGMAMEEIRKNPLDVSMQEVVYLVQKERVRSLAYAYAKTEFYTFLLQLITA